MTTWRIVGNGARNKPMEEIGAIFPHNETNSGSGLMTGDSIMLMSVNCEMALSMALSRWCQRQEK